MGRVTAEAVWAMSEKGPARFTVCNAGQQVGLDRADRIARTHSARGSPRPPRPPFGERPIQYAVDQGLMPPGLVVREDAEGVVCEVRETWPAVRRGQGRRISLKQADRRSLRVLMRARCNSPEMAGYVDARRVKRGPPMGLNRSRRSPRAPRRPRSPRLVRRSAAKPNPPDEPSPPEPPSLVDASLGVGRAL
jgi:hypothetical protein